MRKDINLRPLPSSLSFLLRAILLCVIVCTSTSTLADEDLSDGWTYKGEKKQVHLYMRDYPNSSLPEFRARTVIQSSMASVLGVLLDIDACAKWVHQCKKASLIEQRSVNEKVVYQINKIPFARDRDIVFLATLNFSDNGKNVSIYIKTVTDYCADKKNEQCEKIKKASYIRITEGSGHYQLQELEPNLIEVTWQQHLNLSGNIPNWIVRGQLDNLAYNSLAGLRKQASNTQYQSLALSIQDNQLVISQSPP